MLTPHKQDLYIVIYNLSRWHTQINRHKDKGALKIRLKNYQLCLAYTREWSKIKSLTRVRLFETPWTVAYQAPLSTGFSRQEHWSGLLFPSPGDPPNPGNKPRSPALHRPFTVWASREATPERGRSCYESVALTTDISKPLSGWGQEEKRWKWPSLGWK